MCLFYAVAAESIGSARSHGVCRGRHGGGFIFSLLIPALEQSAPMGQWAFLPAVIGFGVGVAFLLLLDHIIPHLHMNAETAEGPRSHLKKTTMLIWR